MVSSGNWKLEVEVVPSKQQNEYPGTTYDTKMKLSQKSRILRVAMIPSPNLNNQSDCGIRLNSRITNRKSEV